MLKTLLGQVKEYKKASILTPIFMLLEVAMEMVIPLLMASIIDNGVNAGDLNHIVKIGVLMVIIAGIGLYAGISGGYYGAEASAGFAANLRGAMFKKIQTFSFSDIDSFSQASLITRMTTDVTNIQNAYQMALRMGTRAPASMVVALILSYKISRSLSFIYIVALGFLCIVIAIIMVNIKRIFEVIFVRYDAMNNSVRENISGIRVVKAFVREAYEKAKFKDTSKNIYKMFIKVDIIFAAMMPIMMATVYATILAMSWFGAKDIVYGDLTTGELMSLLSYCMNILFSLMMFAAVFGMITISMAPMRRVYEVIKQDASIENPQNPINTVNDGSIVFENVSFGYYAGAEEYVLKDIDLNIKAGETIGVIGGTGSGKTSLVSLISRLYDVSKGRILVGGVDVRDYDIESLRNAVSVVLQKNTLFSGSIYENLRWGNPDATDEECKRVCEIACADEFIVKNPDGYNRKIEQGGANVSGGQKQRLCIARALLKNPKILILDDSTSAVDTATDAKIRNALKGEMPNTTKIIIAQRIASVCEADRIIVLDNGIISGMGTHEELLLSNEIYRDVYESQTKGDEADFDEVG